MYLKIEEKNICMRNRWHRILFDLKILGLVDSYFSFTVGREPTPHR
jgi:hypothetical protein